MTDTVTVAIVVSVPPTLVGLVALLKLFNIGKKVDGRLDDMLRTAAAMEDEIRRLNSDKRGTPVDRPPVTMSAEGNIKVETDK